MERSAATAALEGRYAALRACADRLSSEEFLDVIELPQREKDAACARQAVALRTHGNTISGPPPRIDLDTTLETGTAPWDQILLDFPPRPPAPPEVIPF